eukprot:584464-Rhodomonas_salina.1
MLIRISSTQVDKIVERIVEIPVEKLFSLLFLFSISFSSSFSFAEKSCALSLNLRCPSCAWAWAWAELSSKVNMSACPLSF